MARGWGWAYVIVILIVIAYEAQVLTRRVATCQTKGSHPVEVRLTKKQRLLNFVSRSFRPLGPNSFLPVSLSLILMEQESQKMRCLRNIGSVSFGKFLVGVQQAGKTPQEHVSQKGVDRVLSQQAEEMNGIRDDIDSMEVRYRDIASNW